MSDQNITISGTTQLMGFTIPTIIGGFGESQRAVLAKTIAEFHGKKTDDINRAINRNRDRFTDGVDLIDLKSLKDILTHLVSNHILSQDSINRSKNIYLFSERGYYKLTKILDDDIAWEVIEMLIAGYFRAQTQTELSANARVTSFPVATDLKERLALIEVKRKLLLIISKIPAEALPLLHKSLYEVSRRLGETSPSLILDTNLY